MPGQYSTRRNPETGRLEKIPAAEQGSLKASAEGIKPPIPDLPAERPGAATDRDRAFIAENTQQEPPPLPQAPPVQPPPLPPPPLPGKPPQQMEPQPEEGDGAGAVASGVSAGRVLGPVGAVVGGGAAWAASQSFKKAPIGSLEGSGQTGGGDQEVLRQILDVQRGIARVGSPIKDAILTNPSNSRM